MEDLRDIIIERFAALAGAHDLLLSSNFAAADFKDIVERSLSVHGGKFVVEGPRIELSPQASLSFALVLHELGTNAVKYGSLRSPGGVVNVSWGVAENDFCFQWHERDGCAIAGPTHHGFGSKLIKSSLEGFGTLDVAYPPTGFQLMFSASLERLRYGVAQP